MASNRSLPLPPRNAGEESAQPGQQPRPTESEQDRTLSTLGPAEPSAPEVGGAGLKPTDWVRLHPAYIVITFLRTLRQMILPLVVVLISGGGRQGYADVIIALVTGLLTSANAILSWWFTTYQVTERAVTLHSGWLNRQERSVPLERIHSISVQESLVARLLGVVSLKIETAAAGPSRADISLDAIAREEAWSLREQLIAARARLTSRPVTTEPEEWPTGEAASGAAPVLLERDARLGPFGRQPPPMPRESGELIRAITLGELLVAGMTSGRVGPTFAIVGVLVQFGTELFPDTFFDRIAEVLPGLSYTIVVAILLAVALISWVISIVATMLSFGGFTLRTDGEYLHIASGLLDRRRTTVPLSRIQAITISEGWLRQPFGYASILFVSAGSGPVSASSGVLFPLIKRSEISEFLGRSVPQFAPDLAAAETRGNRPPRRARSRYVTSRLWPLLFVTVGAIGVAGIVPASPWWWGLGLLVLAPFGALYGLLTYRDTYWQVDAEERYVARTRGMARTTTIVPRLRIQQRHIVQNLFQRRASLATFRIDYAASSFSRGMSVRHMPVEEAYSLAGRLALGSVPRRRKAPSGPSPLVAAGAPPAPAADSP